MADKDMRLSLSATLPVSLSLTSFLSDLSVCVCVRVHTCARCSVVWCSVVYACTLIRSDEMRLNWPKWTSSEQMKQWHYS